MIVTATSGASLDADGYRISLNGGPEAKMSIADVRTLNPRSVTTEYQVELADVAPNCTVPGGHLQPLSLHPGDQATVQFDVVCSYAPRPIAFVTDRNDNNEIYAMESDGSGPVRLTNDPGQDAGPAWSPDGRTLAFALDGVIHLMDAGGTDRRRLRGGVSPTWSPDGSSIALTQWEYDPSGWDWPKASLWIAGADGSGIARLTDESLDAWSPSWSPHGGRVAFSASQAGSTGIYLIDLDGSNMQILTDHNGGGRDAVWSPDGTRIAFTSHREGNDEVLVMNADGSNPVNLTNHPANDTEPTWSPDGTRIAFTTDRDGNAEIYVMAADGSDPVNLTNNPAWDRGPAWAPNTPPTP